jgi:hypothetical protein
MAGASHTNGKLVDDDRIPAPSENSRNWARTGVPPLLACRAVPDKLWKALRLELRTLTLLKDSTLARLYFDSPSRCLSSVRKTSLFPFSCSLPTSRQSQAGQLVSPRPCTYLILCFPRVVHPYLLSKSTYTSAILPAFNSFFLISVSQLYTKGKSPHKLRLSRRSCPKGLPASAVRILGTFSKIPLA